MKKRFYLFLLGAMLIGGCGSAPSATNDTDSSEVLSDEGTSVVVSEMMQSEEDLGQAETSSNDFVPAQSNANLASGEITESNTNLASGISPEASSNLSETNVQESEEQTPYGYDLIMVGDVLLHTRVEESCLQEDGSYEYSSLFEQMKDEISAADTAIVNQEVILGGIELGVSGYPAFNAPYEVADALVEAGFDVVCHGTNHALDKGSRGLLNCLSYWESVYPQIEVLGIHDSAEDQAEISYIDAHGVTIGILNFTYSTNGISMPSDMPYLVDMLDKEKVRTRLREAREHADFLMVCPHWGTEYRLSKDASQERWCNLFLEEGVDLVLGTHPHVIEPIEWLEEPETGHRMLVYYSLGNYINWTSGTREGVANRMVGGMAKVHLALDDTGKPYIENYGVRALVTHVEEGAEMVQTYPLAEYTPELAEKNAIRSQDSAFTYEYCVQLCNEIWGELWE